MTEISPLLQKHILRTDQTTSDQYDVWNTKLGQSVKKIYYKHKFLGLLPSAALVLFDFYPNNGLRFGYRKRKYPIAYAHHALITMEVYKKTGDQKYLSKAKTSLDWLIGNYSKGYSGYCWGINMPWVSKMAVYDENIPHVTHTPYVLEALLLYQELTKSQEYDIIISSILDFIENDLNEIIDTPSLLAVSYSPEPESRIVINANSYAMLCYALLLDRSPYGKAYIEDKIMRLYHFLVENQKEDGSWLYFADNAPGNFIDCFHSCFVLKNMLKVKEILPLPYSEKVIVKGYDYVKNNLWDAERNLFRRFSITDRLSLVKYDLYDNAEMLHLAIELGDRPMILKLSTSIEKNFVSGTDVYSNIILPNLKINKNHLRWATLPYLYALSKMT